MAVLPYIYSGQGFSLQRDKSRFVLPSSFRNTVRESSGKPVLCLAKHDRWECLIGFGMSRVEKLAGQLEREEQVAIQKDKEFDRDKRAMDLYGFHDVPFDDSGRFVMPEALITSGRIGTQLYFHGAGEFFTVWNPDELARMGNGWESTQAICESLAAKELKKARKK